MTTLESLSALTDEQLIEKVAVEVMGWKKVTKPTQSGIGTYDGWDHGDGSYVFATKEWRPLTDWNHTMEVVKKLCEAGSMVSCDFEGVDMGAFVEIHGLAFHTEESHYNEPAQRAICLAALLAVSPNP